MKISNIQAYQIDSLRSKQNEFRNNNFVYSFTALNSDSVSFGAKELNSSNNAIVSTFIQVKPNISISILKHIPKLPCAYCGKPMLSIKEYNNVVSKTSSAKGKELVKVLNSNRQYLRRFKSNLADNLILYAKNNPKDDLQQLLIKMVPEYLSTLENEQLEVLKFIQKKYAGSFKSEEEQKVFGLLMQETIAWIKNESGGPPFKCKQFYAELENVLKLPIFRNRSAVKKILKAAKKMPQSTESESAFVVKYSRRAPHEIACQLYREPLVTTEHVKPQCVGGKTEMPNLVMACSNCNNAERSSIPMDIFVKRNPKIEKNIKNQFHALLELGNNSSKRLLNTDNSLKKDALASYVSDVAKTFMKESKNALDLNEFIIN